LHVRKQLAVAHERFRVQHRGVLENANARVEQPRVMELSAQRSPVVRVRGNEQPTRTPRGGIPIRRPSRGR
jgi:hypothetical protein